MIDRNRMNVTQAGCSLFLIASPPLILSDEIGGALAVSEVSVLQSSTYSPHGQRQGGSVNRELRFLGLPNLTLCFLLVVHGSRTSTKYDHSFGLLSWILFGIQSQGEDWGAFQ
jgi:hypothetical protein